MISFLLVFCHIWYNELGGDSMNEIKCPHCGTVFQIQETDYLAIVKQVRDKEFASEIASREKQYQANQESAVKLAEAELEKKFTKQLGEQNLEISVLKKELSHKEEETKHKLEVAHQAELTKKSLEIEKLKGELQLKDTELKHTVQEAVIEKEQEISHLNNELTISKNEYLLKEKNLREHFEEKIKDKDEQIAYYRDFKARQSTKMIGESLEQHCSNEFNRLRPLFKNCTFEKDNDIKTGSKGDFIFRDFDEDGTEVVSIMFEMKNEADTTATKHKNEDFLKELDKDRREKKCEYAVLVSLLELDNDYYNNGIVDMSYQYDKMYVIRPQFFIPLITLIRGMAVHALTYKKELQVVQNQNIDISHFEEDITNFKESFGRNYRLASEKFKKAIDEIDKTIDHLQKTKEALLSSENNLRIAKNKAEDLTIKKLTHHNETVAKMFEELKEQKETQSLSDTKQE